MSGNQSRDGLLIGTYRLLLHFRSICCKVLGKVADGIAFYLKFTGIERYSSRRLRPYAQGMIRIIRSETGFLNLLRREISRKLMNHRADDLKMGEFICSLMLDININLRISALRQVQRAGCTSRFPYGYSPIFYRSLLRTAVSDAHGNIQGARILL